MIQDRAAGAIMGGLIGDAVGLCCHWYYDLNEMRKNHGDWISDYTTPLPGRYHAGQKAGQLSQTGHITIMLLRSVLEHKDYVETDFGKFPFQDRPLPPTPGEIDINRPGIFPNPDPLLIPSCIAAVVSETGISIEPAWKASLVWGLPCAIYHQLPAAYYLAARFSSDFESAVLHAINGGGQNMSRAFLTGALVGAQVGLSKIPPRLIAGLERSDELTALAREMENWQVRDNLAKATIKTDFSEKNLGTLHSTTNHESPSCDAKACKL